MKIGEEILYSIADLEKKVRTLEEHFRYELWKKADKKDVRELALCMKELTGLMKEFLKNREISYNYNAGGEFKFNSNLILPESLKDIIAILKTCERPLTYEEISKKAGKNVKTVRNYIYRLKQMNYPIKISKILGKIHVELVHHFE